MERDKITDAIIGFDDLAQRYGLRYAVTGSVALLLLGVPLCEDYDPHDIDILVLEDNDYAIAEIQRLAKRNGFSPIYSLKIGEVPIDMRNRGKALSEEGYADRRISLVTLMIEGRCINVTDMACTLYNKIRVPLPKNRHFARSIVRRIDMMCRECNYDKLLED